MVVVGRVERHCHCVLDFEAAKIGGTYVQCTVIGSHGSSLYCSPGV